MADLIKKIKIKKQDGTFTDYIPIGAEAQNISTEDGISVENKLKKKPYYFNIVADMKSANYLTTGDTVITLGYFDINDKMGGTYYIKAKESADKEDSYKKIFLDNNLVAVKILPIEDNKSFNILKGTSTLYDSYADSTIENTLNKVKKYFDSIIQTYKVKYNPTTGEFENTAANQETQNTLINNYVNSGGTIAGIKFHVSSPSLLDLFNAYGSETICTAFADFVIPLLNNLPYKNKFTKVWIFNEASGGGDGNECFRSPNAENVITVVERIQAAGYQVSISLAGTYPLVYFDTALKESLDFLTFNLYPKWDRWGKLSSLEDVINRFNCLYEIAEPRLLDDKEVYITEFGCSSSWKAFATPETYYQEGQSRPMVLFLEGFLRSKWAARVSGAWWWYYYDIMQYAPDELLAIKNKEGIRYYE